ncbi:MAG: histidine kinase [Nocardiopsaceae bacterium]|jgi:two-component system sensor histidine kinase DesK|nr:histidine kinase [Nocardiopsaceae bacterium]
MRLVPQPLRSRALRGPLLMLIAVLLPATLAAPVYTVFGSIGGVPPAGYPWLAMPAGVMIFVLQLRHSLAAARGQRPRGGVWTLTALAVLVYAPLPWLGIDWVSEQLVLIASVPMVLRSRWAAAVLLAISYAYLGIQFGRVFPAHPGPAILADYLNWVPYYVVACVITPGAVYASARMVRLAGELHDTRLALADAVVGRERLRVSRDLHDLMGHSLSAISLKGDLAVRLLRRDRPAAVAEITNLTEVAREALAGLRAITSEGDKVSLARELVSARALLAAAGVTVTVRGELPGIPPAADEALAWTVREGTTNILRHASASTATITLERRDGVAGLEIRNDGAPPVTGNGGSGLTGLAGRLGELSGTLSHQRLSDGWFQLTAQVPVTSPEETRWTASGCSSPKIST